MAHSNPNKKTKTTPIIKPFQNTQKTQTFNTDPIVAIPFSHSQYTTSSPNSIDLESSSVNGIPALSSPHSSSKLLDNLENISSFNSNINTHIPSKNTHAKQFDNSTNFPSSKLPNQQTESVYDTSNGHGVMHSDVPVSGSHLQFPLESSTNTLPQQYHHELSSQSQSQSQQHNQSNHSEDFGLDPLYGMSADMLFMNHPSTLNNHIPPNSALSQNPAMDAFAPTNNSNDLISWLFSDAMLESARDPVLSPSFAAWDSPMALQNLITSPVASTQGEMMALSESKRFKLLQLIPEVVGSPNSTSSPGAETFTNNTTLASLQRYIAHYWLFFHPQYPILHRPTFVPDKCPEGLLWTIIIIGAAFDKCDEFSRAVADPLRWILFGSPDFDPPAKLWVIQSLILLELYEKVMTSRKLHIRGHIHHGSTLQLIRRGPMLTGSSLSRKCLASTAEAALLSMFGDKDISEGIEGGASSIMATACRPGGNFCSNDSINDDESDSVSYKDPWKRWIQIEETKRAALLAFIMDINHATMFGHVTLIGVHELRVSLPCHEDLWESNNPDEVIGKSSNGSKKNMGGRDSNSPTGIPFLEALKRTLNKQPVQTESFGRKVILSGLMSIQNGMQQRELQIASIGWGAFKDTWREIMRSAYMFWRNDFRNTLHNLKTERSDCKEKSHENLGCQETKLQAHDGLQSASSYKKQSRGEGINSKNMEFHDEFSDYEMKKREDKTTADITSSEKRQVIPVSLQNSQAIDILTEIHNFQFNGAAASTENEIYTGPDGHIYFRPSTSKASRISDLIANPPKFVLDIQGCVDPLLHIAMIDMYIAQYDLQYYCGITSIFNSSVKRADYIAAKRRVIEWVKSPQGTESLHFAVHFLKEMYLCGDHKSRIDCEKEVDLCPNPFSDKLTPSATANLESHTNSDQNGHSASFSNQKQTNNGSYYSSESNKDKRRSHSEPAYSNNPYLAIYDAIPHRPYIVFICAMLIWTYGHVIGGPEANDLWTRPPPLPRFLFDRKAKKAEAKNPDSEYFIDEYGCMNGYPVGGYNANQIITPAILGRHYFVHMKNLPHKHDGLEYLEWLSHETSKAMASRTCVGIAGAGTSNKLFEDSNNELDPKNDELNTKLSHPLSQTNAHPFSANGNSAHADYNDATSATVNGDDNIAIEINDQCTHDYSHSSSREGSITSSDGISCACNNNPRFYNTHSSPSTSEENGQSTMFSDSKDEGHNDQRKKGTTASSVNSSSFQINHTAGLLKLAIESLQNHHSEITAEGERLLTHCLERSIGRKEIKCHYLRWEC